MQTVKNMNAFITLCTATNPKLLIIFVTYKCSQASFPKSRPILINIWIVVQNRCFYYTAANELDDTDFRKRMRVDMWFPDYSSGGQIRHLFIQNRNDLVDTYIVL